MALNCPKAARTVAILCTMQSGLQANDRCPDGCRPGLLAVQRPVLHEHVVRGAHLRYLQRGVELHGPLGGDPALAAHLGLGRIVTLYCRSAALHQSH